MSLPSGFGRNLRLRLLTALVALPALVLALVKGPPALGVAIVALALLGGLHEFYALAAARGLRPLRLTGALLGAAIFLEETWPLLAGAPLWPLAALALLLAAVLRGGAPEQAVPGASVTLLGAGYLGGLGGALAGLLLLPPPSEGGWRLLLLLAIVMIADTFAFFGGHAFGRHRLAPALSPGKTVEGALFGLVGGVVGALGLRALAPLRLPLLDTAVLGLLVAALAVAGDLAESLLKRWAGVKDSGRLFPGHGGLLDRLDSLLFGAPALYYYFLLKP